MKAADTRRAFVLSLALEGMAELDDEMKRCEPDSGYTRVALEIGVISASESGASGHASIELDMETARLLVPTLRPLIEAELKKLGVELP